MDFALSVFKLRNERGFASPELHFEYVEEDSGRRWFLDVGGTRLYCVRTGESLEVGGPDQAADSHFMARRVTSALLAGGAGLFVSEATGRLYFTGVEGMVRWGQEFDRLNPLGDPVDDEVRSRVGDWYSAICNHTVLRRALDDAHLALQHPREAVVFIYRGLEWIQKGLGIAWEDLAAPMGVTPAAVREFKKMANHETGVRHASLSGSKLRGDIVEDGSSICALFDAINFARSKLDAAYVPMKPEQVAAVVLRAIRPRAYE